MLIKKVEDALNDQLNAELSSAYLYYSMAAYFEKTNMRGFASWMRIQTQEEMSHTEKFRKFVNDRGGRVLLKAIEAPKAEWTSAENAFAEALKHEQYISGRINDLVALAIQEKDFATKTFLDWFVNEQVEEEASVSEILEDMRMVKQSSQGLFMLNRELGSRTFTMPPAGE